MTTGVTGLKPTNIQPQIPETPVGQFEGFSPLGYENGGDFEIWHNFSRPGYIYQMGFL